MRGDLSLDIVENAIRPILTINVEDYLLGVVPFENGRLLRSSAQGTSRHRPDVCAAQKQFLRRIRRGRYHKRSGVSRPNDVNPLSEQAVTETKEALRRLSRARWPSCFLFRQQRRPNRSSASMSWPNETTGRLRLWICAATRMIWKESRNSVVKRYTLQKSRERGRSAKHSIRRSRRPWGTAFCAGR